MDLTLATVQDNADPEGLGRVRITLLDDDDAAGVSIWARIAAPFAGDGRGLFLLPEVGDEVLVGFLDGRAQQPIVLGALWTGQTQPPTTDPGERVLRTRDGHRISLTDSDSDAARALVIEDAHGSRIEMRQGRIRIRATGALEIESAGVTVNGHAVLLTPAPAPAGRAGRFGFRFPWA